MQKLFDRERYIYFGEAVHDGTILIVSFSPGHSYVQEIRHPDEGMME